MPVSGGLWVDVHAHPGRCFLAGLDEADPLASLQGGLDVAGSITAARAAGLAAVTLSTVADLRVLAPDPVRGLRASRPFRPGEASADHRRQLAGIGRIYDFVAKVIERGIERLRRHGEGTFAGAREEIGHEGVEP